MPMLYRKNFRAGLAPGTLLPADRPQETRITVIDYTAESLEERQVSSIQECFSYRDSKTVTWINIDGRDVDVISQIGKHFGIHPLVLEDIINTGQRPKVEDYGGYLYLVIKMIYFDEDRDDLYSEQVSLVLGPNYVLSFQEKVGDVFEKVRERLRAGRVRIRSGGPDYLAYALLDAIVDQYFLILEDIGEEIDDLEKEIFQDSGEEISQEIHRLKTLAIFLRKQIWPLREVLNSLYRGESGMIHKDTIPYLQDVYDHAIRVNETLEAFREALSSLRDIHLSVISNRMNEVMKVLTIFAVIFIPLTFIAGIYGMNFEYMPELQIKGAYYYALGAMAAIGVGMLFYFKKKGWM